MRAVFSHGGRDLYLMGRREDGTSRVYSISTTTRQVTPIADHLDATNFPLGTLAVTPENDALILPLATRETPGDSERQKPYADRWLKLFRLDLRTHELRLLETQAGEDEDDPAIVGDKMYWVSRRVTKSVGVVGTKGGVTRDIILGREAYLANWSPTGRLAFAIAQYRLADMPMNHDIYIVDMDATATPKGSPRSFIVGNHEDFPPAWSKNGAWIVWHSHRGPSDLPYSGAPGAADDIWLRKAEDPSAPEIRITNDLWDAGLVYWAPDGHSVVYTSLDRAGHPPIHQVWISDIDPATGRASNKRQLHLPADIHDPLIAEWSARGDELAVEDAASPMEHVLWIVSRDGSTARKVATYRCETYGGISWSPDGKSLAFGALDHDRMQIFTVATSGTTPVRLTDGSGNVLLPRISPDGKWIAFSHIETVQTVRERTRSQILPAASAHTTDPGVSY
jgi:Tol biopolymer transport system component